MSCMPSEATAAARLARIELLASAASALTLLLTKAAVTAAAGLQINYTHPQLLCSFQDPKQRRQLSQAAAAGHSTAPSRAAAGSLHKAHRQGSVCTGVTCQLPLFAMVAGHMCAAAMAAELVWLLRVHC